MNTTELAHTKKDDLAAEYYHEWGSEREDMLGMWKNVNPKSGQIARIEVIAENDQIFLHCYGITEEGETDLGTAACELFSSNVSSAVIEGFACNYHFDFMDIRIAGNVKYGVMVIQTYNTFKDGSGRNNYFCREFFCK